MVGQKAVKALQYFTMEIMEPIISPYKCVRYGVQVVSLFYKCLVDKVAIIIYSHNPMVGWV